jgi:hypothetical protein
MRTACLTAAMLILPLAACESSQNDEPAMMLRTPLPLDPTEQHEITGWWSNGSELLELRRDGGFRFYDTRNRYQPPAERGSWMKKSYAVAWLEVYNDLAPLRVRVAISKIGEELALTIPDFAPMLRLDGPPGAPEDRVIGAWTGESGTLTLDENMRYAFRLSKTPGAPITLAGHNGRWVIINESIALQPDSPAQPDVMLDLETVEDDLVLQLEDDTLHRVRDVTALGE